MMDSFEHVIVTKNLTKHYRRPFASRVVPALNGLSLTVEPGAAFGLLGPNGAGKTTFVKLLLSATRPTAGSARIFGRDCRDPRAREQVGYLPENHRFAPYQTGRQMLDFYAALSGMTYRDRKRRADELLDAVGLSEWGGRKIGQYSKGMLQRLGLAQAIMHRPKLLILDEPSDGVDPVGRRQIRDILQRLRNEGTTIFLNSHLLAEVETFCDQVAILRRGELAASGHISALTTGSGYRLAVGALSAALADRLKQTAIDSYTKDNRVHFHFNDLEAVNLAVDLLRRENVFIEEIQRMRSTLEDVFIRTVEAAGDEA